MNVGLSLIERLNVDFQNEINENSDSLVKSSASSSGEP